MTDKNILIVATLASFVDFFETNDIAILQRMGYTVHLAANFNNDYKRDYIKSFSKLGVVIHQIDFQRSPFSFSNISNYRELKSILKDNFFELVHCHTPVGGAIARLAAKRYRSQGTKVVYTVHGLQFCRGESLINWILFYPIEKHLSRYSDIIIAINKEDYSLIKKRFHNSKTYYIPGVGINTESIRSLNRTSKETIRDELGLSKGDFLVFSSGELTKRKNHQIIIKAIHTLNNPNIHYCIAGIGPTSDQLLRLAKKFKMSSQIHLLGFRNDIYDLLNASDMFAFPSRHEGFGVSLLEAMASGLPCTATNVQGIKDLIPNKEVLHNHNDVKGFANTINRFIGDPSFAKTEGQNNQKNSMKFDITKTQSIMQRIYSNILGE